MGSMQTKVNEVTILFPEGIEIGDVVRMLEPHKQDHWFALLNPMSRRQTLDALWLEKTGAPQGTFTIEHEAGSTLLGVREVR